jgi:hypothetical protein
LRSSASVVLGRRTARFEHPLVFRLASAPENRGFEFPLSIFGFGTAMDVRLGSCRFGGIP